MLTCSAVTRYPRSLKLFFQPQTVEPSQAHFSLSDIQLFCNVEDGPNDNTAAEVIICTFLSFINYCQATILLR